MSLISSASRRKAIIAILTMPDQQRPFRGNEQNFIDIIQCGKDQGVPVYVVTVKDIHFPLRRILAYNYNELTKGWDQEWIGIPTVFYNRIPYRSDETQPEVKHLLEQLQQTPGVHLFNPSFFDKWSLFEWLKKSRLTRKYIPSTVKWTPQLKLAPVLNEHRILYLKPVQGKAGSGIMRVLKLPESSMPYRLTVQENKKSTTMKFSRLTTMKTKMAEYMKNEEYIVQQGISLANSKQRPFDLRVLVQKTLNGQWEITGIGARVAGEASITTHVPRGGYIDSPERLLSTIFGEATSRRIMSRAKKAALHIAKQIEKASGYRLGEMSMDLGVDIVGNIWFFEANSKPMKFDEPEIRRKSLERLIQYSKYLSRS